MKEVENALEDADLSLRPEDEGEIIEESTEEVETPIDDIEDDLDYTPFARVQGWRPKEQWKGDDSEWVDAKTFIERGREFQYSLKEKNNRLEQQLKEQGDTIQRFESFTAKQLEKQKAEALADFKRQQKEALEDGDDERFDKLEADKLKAIEEYKPVVKPEAKPTVYAEVEQFKKENTWYGQDPILTREAEFICQSFADKGYSIPDQLKETKRLLIETYPQKFENPRRAAPTVVSRSRPPSAPASKGAKWSDLTSLEQKLAEGQMKQFGWSKDTFLTKYSESESL